MLGADPQAVPDFHPVGGYEMGTRKPLTPEQRVKANQRNREWRLRNLERTREDSRRRAREARQDPVKREKALARTREWRLRPEAIENVRAYHRTPEYVARKEVERCTRQRVFWAMKSMLVCLDCGKEGPDIDFDHRDGTEKLFNPSDGASRSWESLWVEWAKCDPRCAPCHKRRHGYLNYKRSA